MSPTQRSLQKLRREKWLVAVVEHWNAYVKRRQDLFQFGDLLAVKGDVALLVQTTSAANVSARIAKIISLPAARYWLESPSRKIVVHGWAERGARGEKKKWECREVELTSDALGPVVAMIPRRQQKPIRNLELFKRQPSPGELFTRAAAMTNAKQAMQKEGVV